MRPVIASIPLLSLLAEKKRKPALIYLALYVSATFDEIYLVSHTTGILNLLVIIVSGLITRFMSCLVMGYYVVTTMMVREFVKPSSSTSPLMPAFTMARPRPG